MSSKLFGSSGARGLANVELTPTLAAQVGLAVTTRAKAKTVVVGRDTRTSGPMLENALVAGLMSAGTNVKQLGVLPTPVLAYLTRELKADAGIMITASHNPPQYNGLKVFDATGTAYDMKSQDEVEKTISQKQFKMAEWPKVGSSQQTEQSYLYAEALVKKVRLRRKWRIVLDSGCGATFSLAPNILKSLGCTVTALNAQADGFFPARSPEPNAESLAPLAEIVKKSGADIGLGYDGDGDRVAFIDGEGKFADFDQILAAYAAHVTNKRGAVVVTNVEASMSIEKMVEKKGGKVVRARVGDVYLTEEMKKQKAVFGGEPCGAWIHPQFHYCPDGILSSILLLQALEDEHMELAEFVAKTPEFPTVRKNIPCKNSVKLEVMKKLKRSLETAFPRHGETSNIDGIRIMLDKGWMLVRASGTEPMIRLTVEGETLRTANKITEKGIVLVKELVGKVG